ncbi:hypothetical protein BH18ACT17_BH18ACT17_00490 [soil metagenome]
MEGVNVTVEEVRRILVGETPPEVPQGEAALVTGYTEAMRFVLRQADDSAFTWDRGLIVGLHDRVMGGRYPVAGRLRTERPISIVNRVTGEQVFLPAAGAEVEELVDRTCAEMEGRQAHPAVAAAWIHVAVAAVHPFIDGTGRSARILAALAMYRGGFKRPEFTSLEEWWGRHLDDYYSLFTCLGESFDPTTDVTPFIQGHIRAQLHQVRALDLTQKVQRQIWTASEELADRVSLDRRVANALWEAFFGRPVSAGYYRSLANVSPATATSDLGATVSAGLLRAEGQRRGRRYIATLELYERIADDLFIDIDDPSTAKDVIVSELTRRASLTGEAFGFPAPPFDDP